ncbi:MAG: sodium:calcium antiporter [Rickettsiales bacterium]|jgi:cation:H+ antiporter|nr:sodium:calcium antiporter [Rickettsiales bacterium]
MTWIIAFAGLIAMGLGADWLVRGCSRLAHRIGVSEFLVSVIVIGVGITAPEIIVSLIASAQGMGTLVVGNAVASNLFRILGVLGLGALLHPLTTGGEKRKLDLYFVLLAAIVLAWTIADGSVSAFDGIVLFGVFAAYAVAYGIKSASSKNRIHRQNVSWRKIIPLIAGSAVALYFGSYYFMESLMEITASYGLDERVAAILIVAPGTSAPEILITIIAALRRRASIIIGNILGSNMANICLAVAGGAQIAPLAVAPEIVNVDIWILIGVTALFCWQMLHFRRLGRWTGICYLGVMFLLVSLL